MVQLIAHQHQHVKCTEANCSFEGDQHAVTIHKQDRHLIFPPGYQHKRRKQPRAEEDQEGDEDEEAAMAKRFANAYGSLCFRLIVLFEDCMLIE